jgi:hypothetical protein
VFAHEMNKSQKLLLKTWANRMVWFHRLRWQSGAPSALVRASFFWTSGI